MYDAENYTQGCNKKTDDNCKNAFSRFEVVKETISDNDSNNKSGKSKNKQYDNFISL